MSIELSIVIPCYNEEDNIPYLISRFVKAVNNDPSIEIIFVDNGSDDSTGQELADKIIEMNNKNFRVVKVVENIGYGNGILQGLKESRGKVLAWTHADLQTNPEDVIRAFNLYNEFNDDMILIKGRRKKRNIIPYIFTFGKQILATIVLGTKMLDIDAQPKLFSRSFYEKYIKERAPLDFGLDMHVMYYASRHGKIKEIPVKFEKRLFGESKGGENISIRFKLIKRAIRNILELKNQAK